MFAPPPPDLPREVGAWFPLRVPLSLPPPVSQVASAQAPPCPQAPPPRRPPLPSRPGPRLARPAPRAPPPPPRPRPGAGTTLGPGRRGPSARGTLGGPGRSPPPRGDSRGAARAPGGAELPDREESRRSPRGRNASQVGRRQSGGPLRAAPAQCPASLPRRLPGLGGLAPSWAPIVPPPPEFGAPGARAQLALGSGSLAPLAAARAPGSPRCRRAGRGSRRRASVGSPRVRPRSPLPRPWSLPGRPCGVARRGDRTRPRGAPSRGSGEGRGASGPGLNLLVTMHIST